MEMPSVKEHLMLHYHQINSW